MDKRLLSGKWDGCWISCPDAPATEYTVLHFRKRINLAVKPVKFVVHISADNRYRFFVNKNSVCFGPARGDLDNWRFETVDIAPFLEKGENILAAVVWNFGPFKPNAQLSLRTAFLFQADDPENYYVNSNESWKVFQNHAYKPVVETNTFVGGGEEVNFLLYPTGWESLEFDDSNWKNAVIIDKARSRFSHSTGWAWGLVARNIPLMEEKLQRFGDVLRIEKDLNIQDVKNLIDEKASLVIPENKRLSILLDQFFETTAFFELMFSKGKSSKIIITYSEALYNRDGKKQNRNNIENCTIKGNFDIIYPDGKDKRIFRTLWWRTFRFISIDIETKDEILIIEKLRSIRTGYPFEEKAEFFSDNLKLNKIFEVGWRTVRLCAHETYMDCPYYEQLQYVGDTRIQALVSLYVSGDDRLMRNAIELIDNSRLSEGITLSSFPVSGRQVIPPFALYWIFMVYDFAMHRDDFDFVKRWLKGILKTLWWYEERIDKKRWLIGPVEYWNFVDWTEQWPWDNNCQIGGVPPGADEGFSSIITLHLALAFDVTANLFFLFKDKKISSYYKDLSKRLKVAVLRYCWDYKKGLIADTPDKKSFSQHANINGILAGLFSKDQSQKIMKRILQDDSIVRCSLYYRFYLFEALKKCGLGNMYTELLDPWERMLDYGLTTFAEVDDVFSTRSDCHGWSGSPVYHLLSLVLGIRPLSWGFKRVIIAPHLNGIKKIRGCMPHQKGIIKVEFISDKNFKGVIELPDGLDGIFYLNGKSLKIKPGKNYI